MSKKNKVKKNKKQRNQKKVEFDIRNPPCNNCGRESNYYSSFCWECE